MNNMLDFNTEFTVRELNIEDLVADYLYQRPLDLKRAERIANDFLEVSENLPVINNREGKHWIVNGQHTIKAKELLGGKTIKCKVLNEGLTSLQEALLFFILNKEQKEHTERAKIRVRYRFGDPYIRQLDDMANKYGFAIDWDGDSSELHRKIFAIVKIYRIYNERGADVMDKTFQIIKECFPINRHTLCRQFVGGVSLFVFKYPDYLGVYFEEFLNIMQNTTVDNLLRRANDFRLKYSNSIRIDSDQYVALSILDFVNKGRFGKRSLDNLILEIKD